MKAKRIIFWVKLSAFLYLLIACPGVLLLYYLLPIIGFFAIVGKLSGASRNEH